MITYEKEVEIQLPLKELPITQAYLLSSLPHNLLCHERVLIQMPIEMEKSLRIPVTYELPLPTLYILVLLIISYCSLQIFCIQVLMKLKEGKKYTLCPLIHLSKGNLNSDFLYNRLVQPSFELNVNRIIQCICVWHFPLDIISLRFIYGVVYFSSLLFTI